MTCGESVKSANTNAFPSFVGGDSGDLIFLLAINEPADLVISTCGSYTTLDTNLLLFSGAPTHENSTLLASSSAAAECRSAAPPPSRPCLAPRFSSSASCGFWGKS